MANWTTLKAAINQVVKANNNQEITGTNLQSVLNSIVSILGEHATFAGIALTTTNPGVPDGPTVYFATAPGTYVNFDGLEVGDNEAALLYWNNGAWAKQNTGFVNASGISGLERQIDSVENVLINKKQELAHTFTNGYWDGAAVISYSGWHYTSHIPVQAGDVVYISGNVGESGKLYYAYNNTGTKLKEGARGSFSGVVLIENDGYIICNCMTDTDLEVYKCDSSGLASILFDSMGSGKNQEYAVVLNKIPELNTTAGTLTFPSGTSIYSSHGSVTLTNDIVFTKGSMGTQYCVLNLNTLEVSVVSISTDFVLPDNKCILALVRWNECVYQANFVSYKLNGTLIEFKSKSPNAFKISSNEINANSAYGIDSYAAGDSISSILTPTVSSGTVNRYSTCIMAKKGSVIKIYSQSASTYRLYMLVSTATNKVIEVSPARQVNAIINIVEDCYAYINLFSTSATIEVLSTIPALSAAIVDTEQKLTTYANDQGRRQQEYATVLNRAPLLDTVAGTLTFPAGTAIYSNNGSATLTNDLVFTKGSFGTQYCVFNFNSNAASVIGAITDFILPANKCILALVRWNECIYQGNFSEYYLNGELVQFKPKVTGDRNAPVVTKMAMRNPHIELNGRNAITNPKILLIGNSYLENSTSYIRKIIRAVTGSESSYDSTLSMYNVRMGSASFKDWIDTYFNAGPRTYNIERIVGTNTPSFSTSSLPAVYQAGNGGGFIRALDYSWDIIIIQQLSTYAPYYDRWEEDSEAGHLNEFIQIIRRGSGLSPMIGFNLVHSYWSGYGSNTEGSSLKRWEKIAESTKKIMANYDIDFVVPYGTAIQNLRASSLNNQYDLTIDGTHLAPGLAQYTACLAMFNSIVGATKNILPHKLIAPVIETVTPSGQYPSSCISITEANAKVARKAAFLAACDMFKVQNPDDMNDRMLIL